MARSADPGPRDDEPYAAQRPLLPTSLGEALQALEGSALYRREMGDVFIDYFARLKRSELNRFLKWHQQNPAAEGEPTEWEQNEYFDFF